MDKFLTTNKRGVMVPAFPVRLLCLVLLIFQSVLLSGCSGDPEIAELVRQLNSDDADAKRSAAKKIEDIGPRAGQAVRALGRCLTDGDSKVRYRAAKALSTIGHASVEVQDELTQSLVNDPDEQTRYFVAKAIDEFAEEAGGSVSELAKALGDANPKVRYFVAKTLGKIGAESEPALPQLMKLLKDEDEHVRKAAEDAVRRVKKKSNS